MSTYIQNTKNIQYAARKVIAAFGHVYDQTNAAVNVRAYYGSTGHTPSDDFVDDVAWFIAFADENIFESETEAENRIKAAAWDKLLAHTGTDADALQDAYGWYQDELERDDLYERIGTTR